MITKLFVCGSSEITGASLQMLVSDSFVSDSVIKSIVVYVIDYYSSDSVIDISNEPT